MIRTIHFLLRDDHYCSSFSDPFMNFRHEYFGTPIGLSLPLLQDSPLTLEGSMPNTWSARDWDSSSSPLSIFHDILSGISSGPLWLPGLVTDLLSSVNFVWAVVTESLVESNPNPLFVQLCSNISWIKAQFALVLADVCLQSQLALMFFVEYIPHPMSIRSAHMTLFKLAYETSRTLARFFEILTTRLPCTIVRAYLKSKPLEPKVHSNKLLHRALCVKYFNQLRQELMNKVSLK